MTKDEAVDLACLHAKQQPESYYSEPFTPHAWVVSAIQSAYKQGQQQRTGFVHEFCTVHANDKALSADTLRMVLRDLARTVSTRNFGDDSGRVRLSRPMARVRAMSAMKCWTAKMTPQRARKIARECCDHWYGGEGGIDLPDAVMGGIMDAVMEERLDTLTEAANCCLCESCRQAILAKRNREST